MAGQFPGVAEAINALGTGRLAQQRGELDANDRLTRARKAVADMDYAVDRATNQKYETNALGSLVEMYGPNATEEELSTIAKRATELLAARNAYGVNQKNTARGYALESLEKGGIDPDRQNQLTAIAGDKLLSPTNVNVDRASEATIGATQARGRASDASAAASRARAEYSKASTPGTSGDSTKYTNFTPTEVALTFGATPQDKDEYNKFRVWKAKKSMEFPEYRNAQHAYDMWLIEKSGGAPGASDVPDDPLTDAEAIELQRLRNQYLQ